MSNMPAMPGWRSVTWPQRGLVIGVTVSALAATAGALTASFTTSTTPSLLLWGAVALNDLLLLVLGPIAFVTTRRWFRQCFPLARLRRQRRAVRRSAVLLGLVAYLAHQTLVVLLEPRLALESFMQRRWVRVPVVSIPDRLGLAWAFTAVAFGYVVLAWLLWRSAGVPDPMPSARSSPVLEGPPPPGVAAPPADTVEALPRDPVTGRVVRRFDL